MTGAVACLAGLEGVAVIVHGSSGCYFYPATLINAPILGTFLIESDIIFGAEERLREVIGGISDADRIAVVNTCVPAVMGEDIRSMIEEYDVLLIDSPGFLGDFEAGYRTAIRGIAPAIDPDAPGVNIDGISLADPFYRGSLMEGRRLLIGAGAGVAATFCADRYAALNRAGGLTVGVNPDLASGIGEWCGSLLGLDGVRAAFERLEAACGEVDAEPVYRECARAEKQIAKACDKYLRRFDPPRAAVFSGFSYAVHAAETLERYLDADIVAVASRSTVQPSRYRAEQVTDLSRVREVLREHAPDLIIGSSYEQTLAPDAAFVGLTPPLRGRILLHAHPLAGIEGTLYLMEEVLNACMDRERSCR